MAVPTRRSPAEVQFQADPPLSLPPQTTPFAAPVSDGCALSVYCKGLSQIAYTHSYTDAGRPNPLSGQQCEAVITSTGIGTTLTRNPECFPAGYFTLFPDELAYADADADAPPPADAGDLAAAAYPPGGVCMAGWTTACTTTVSARPQAWCCPPGQWACAADDPEDDAAAAAVSRRRRCVSTLQQETSIYMTWDPPFTDATGSEHYTWVQGVTAQPDPALAPTVYHPVFPLALALPGGPARGRGRRRPRPRPRQQEGLHHHELAGGPTITDDDDTATTLEPTPFLTDDTVTVTETVVSATTDTLVFTQTVGGGEEDASGTTPESPESAIATTTTTTATVLVTAPPAAAAATTTLWRSGQENETATIEDPVDERPDLSKGAIAGTSIGAAALVLAIAGLVVFYRRRQGRGGKARGSSSSSSPSSPSSYDGGEADLAGGVAAAREPSMRQTSTGLASVPPRPVDEGAATTVGGRKIPVKGSQQGVVELEG
ncbi:hypothetical protein F4780DRAFT_792874 [Xylariomycetidae sp. FL0641]|nr:hypothetical protein F4780DRAFT_792874 [Xylariomycetidae sp. FL0641]